jgi:hypothetical protein
MSRFIQSLHMQQCALFVWMVLYKCVCRFFVCTHTALTADIFADKRNPYFHFQTIRRAPVCKSVSRQPKPSCCIMSFFDLSFFLDFCVSFFWLDFWGWGLWMAWEETEWCNCSFALTRHRKNVENKNFWDQRPFYWDLSLTYVGVREWERFWTNSLGFVMGWMLCC